MGVFPRKNKKIKQKKSREGNVNEAAVAFPAKRNSHSYKSEA